MRIARVFPRRTKATPIDDLAFTGLPGLFPPEVDEVHVSVTYTYDVERAYRLAHQWERVAPLKIGGPAFGEPSGEFIPGRYLKQGYVITSRGCPNRCWFCSVWKRERTLKELPITDGWILQDDNILACSENHIRAVFEMLKHNKKNGGVELRGIEPTFLKPWHIDLMLALKPRQIWTAYDDSKEYDAVRYASNLLREAGFTRNTLRCYCLIGFDGDSIEKALARLMQIVSLGMFPFAMLYRGNDGKTLGDEWNKFQRTWARPASIAAEVKRLSSKT